MCKYTKVSFFFPMSEFITSFYTNLRENQIIYTIKRVDNGIAGEKNV
jgi:hypothetical protein